MSDNSAIFNIIQSRRSKIFQISMCLAFGSFLFYLLLYCFYDFNLFLPANISIFVYLLINVGAYVLFRYRKYLLAVHLFSASLMLELMILTFFIFGKVPGLHFYFILFAFVTIPHFSLKENVYPMLYFILSLCSFLYVEFFNPVGIVEYPQSFIIPVKLASIILSFSTTLLVFVIYYRMGEKKEYELSEAKNELEYINHELAESNIEIENQKKSLIELNQSLLEANRTKNLFFSIISHDLKNPLSGFVGLLEILNSRVDTYDKDSMKKILDTITSSANSLNKLVIDLLEWSRIQTGRIEARFAPCVLKDIIEEVEAMCGNMAQSKNINFNISVPEALIFKTDKSLLGTILRNLFTNAIKYSHPGDEITVSVSKQEERILLSVKDNGVGMTTKIAENLFKIDKVNSLVGTNQERGTGLGLIITHEFVKILNGTITVKSNPGKGCECMISLPLYS